MPTDRELIAHILRRTTFGPFRPGRRAGQSGGRRDCRDGLGAKPKFPPTGSTARTTTGAHDALLGRADARSSPERARADGLVLARPLVSSLDKASEPPCGDSTSVAQARSGQPARVDARHRRLEPAMLAYLDGDGSRGEMRTRTSHARSWSCSFSARNFNELDVPARRGPSADGGRKDTRGPREPRVGVRPAGAVLGSRRKRTTADAIDALCDHPACRFVATRSSLLVGASPSDARAEEMAGVFRKSGLEIKPLVQNISRTRLRRRAPCKGAHKARVARSVLALRKYNRPRSSRSTFSGSRSSARCHFGRRTSRAGRSTTGALGRADADRTNLLMRLPLAKAIVDRVEPGVGPVSNTAGSTTSRPRPERRLQRSIDKADRIRGGLELLSPSRFSHRSSR